MRLPEDTLLMPTLHWDIATAYDLFVSQVCSYSPRSVWSKTSSGSRVRSRLPAGHQSFWKMPAPFYQSPCAGYTSCRLDVAPLPTLSLPWRRPPPPSDFIRCCQHQRLHRNSSLHLKPSACASRGVQPSWRVFVPSYSARGKILLRPPGFCLNYWTPFAHAAEFGEAYLQALNAYQEVFFAEEERRLQPMLESGVAQAQALAQTLSLEDLLISLSRGVHFAGLSERKTVILAPYWANPLGLTRM